MEKLKGWRGRFFHNYREMHKKTKNFQKIAKNWRAPKRCTSAHRHADVLTTRAHSYPILKTPSTKRHAEEILETPGTPRTRKIAGPARFGSVFSRGLLNLIFLFFLSIPFYSLRRNVYLFKDGNVRVGAKAKTCARMKNGMKTFFLIVCPC